MRQFLRSAAIYGFGNVLSAGVPFLLLPILTRALSPEQYGVVVSFYLLVGVTAALAGLGLQSAVGVRWLDTTKGDPRTYTATAIVVIACSTAVAAIVAALVGSAFDLGLSPRLCALAAVLSGANVVQAMRFAVWQSLGRPVEAAMLQVTHAVLNVGFSLVAVLVLGAGGVGRVLAATVAGILIAGYGVASLVRDGSATSVRSHEASQLLRFGLPLAPHVLAGSLLASADRFAVVAHLGTASLGVYGVATQFGQILTVLADAATKAYVPQMYRLLSARSLRAHLTYVGVTYLSVPFWIVVALVIWALLLFGGRWLVGPEFGGAVGMSLWFLAGSAMSAVYLNVAGVFFFTGRTELMSATSIFAAVVALAFAGPAVRQFGMLGGGLTFLVAQGALLAGAWVLSIRALPLPWLHPTAAVRAVLHRVLEKR